MILFDRVSISLFSCLLAYILYLLVNITYVFFILKHLLHDLIFLNLDGLRLVQFRLQVDA